MTPSRRSRPARLLIAAGCSLVIVAGVGPARGRPAAAQPPIGSEADTALAWALGQLIYDVPDDSDGVSSALRGHSLARTMYGYNDQVPNTQPFNGTGRLHFIHGPHSGAISGTDDHRLVNYQAFDGEPLRDPERYGSRAGAGQVRAFFTAGFNAPYTYPDLNSMFVAAARDDGTVITPSFHRDWLFGPLDAANPNWTSSSGKYLTLRPRPADMGPGFPLPESRHGDVKNVVDAPGGNDSIWMDLGYPVRSAPDGRKFKPLFAFYVEDLDNVRRGPGQDWHVPSITPWLWDRAQESFYAVPPSDPSSPPVGPAIPFPDLTRRGDPFGNPGEPVPSFSEFRTPGLGPDQPETDWRGYRALALVAQGIDRVGHQPEDRAALSRLAASLGGRVDLNRQLPEYPRQRPFVTPAQLDGARVALLARQQLAQEIYRQLLVVTGVSPVPQSTIEDPSDAQLSARRWLAQLAANIVDYVDEDEISTPFHFYSTPLDGLLPGDVGASTPTPAGEVIPRYWVFGTELPAIVLNEVMTELEEPTRGVFSVKVWAELYHPVLDVPRPDPDGRPDPAPVPLFARTGGSGQGYSAYRVVVAQTGPTGRTALFDHPDNVLGSPDRVLGVAEFGPTLGTVGSPHAKVPASIGHDDYLIVGPTSEGGQDAQQTIRATSTRPAGTHWHRSEGMEFTIFGDPPIAPITVVLRRLANPHLPPDPRPAVGDGANPFYNPYLTIDYLERIPLLGDPAVTQSSGKLQPFAAHPNRIRPQTSEQGGGTRHTLGQANEPREPFDWLVHLDRPLTGPTEVLSVTGVRPHELTHRFITTPAGEPADFAHRAPWFDEDLGPPSPPRSHRLYRLFEFLETRDHRPGIAAHGRVPGKININGIHDREAFRALLGRQLEGQLGLDRITEIWERLLQLRSPGMLGPDPRVTASDRPFLSPAVGILPDSDPQAPGRVVGIEDTIFRAWDPGAPGDARRLFDVVDQDHPYLRNALLTAIDDRITVRSNVFAVWLTVGFFEVVDDTSSPIRLGAEIGQAANRRTRHRFFAIVDRTQLQLFGAREIGGRVEVTRYLTRSQGREGAVPAAGRYWVPLEALSGLTATEERDATGAPTGRLLPWRIVPGSYLFVDTGASRELVLVTGVDPTRPAIEAIFTRPHVAGFEVSMPGNPGPQPDFDPRADRFRDVVPQTVRLE